MDFTQLASMAELELSATWLVLFWNIHSYIGVLYSRLHALLQANLLLLGIPWYIPWVVSQGWTLDGTWRIVTTRNGVWPAFLRSWSPTVWFCPMFGSAHSCRMMLGHSHRRSPWFLSAFDSPKSIVSFLGGSKFISKVLCGFLHKQKRVVKGLPVSSFKTPGISLREQGNSLESWVLKTRKFGSLANTSSENSNKSLIQHFKSRSSWELVKRNHDGQEILRIAG